MIFEGLCSKNRLLVVALAACSCSESGSLGDGAVEAFGGDSVAKGDRGPDVRPRDLGRADATGSALPWVFLAGGRNGYAHGNSIALESSGRVYLAGTTVGAVPFGPTLHNQPGPLVARLSSSGTLGWVKNPAGGAGWGASIALGQAGRILVAGSFSGTKQFGPTTLTSLGNTDAFVAWMDTNGAVLSAVSFGGRGWESAEAIATDPSGNAFVVGSFDSATHFGSTTLDPAGGGDIFMARIDPQGKVLWALRGGGDKLDTPGRTVAVDQAGNAYVPVNFWGPAAYGGISVEPKSVHDSAVIKIDASGKVLWAAQVTGHLPYLRTVALDGAGNPHVTGTFAGTAKIGSKTVEVETVSPAYDTFVAKLNGSGVVQWAVAAADAEAYAIVVDAAGASYLTGGFTSYAAFGQHWVSGVGQNDIFVARLGPKGSWLGAISAGGRFSDVGMDIALDAAGNIHVTGATHGDPGSTYGVNQGSVTFGKQTFQLDGAKHLFVWKIPAGQL